MTRSYWLATSAVLVALTSAHTAQAQAQDQTAESSVQSQEATGLDDIIVTAQRRSENLQRAAVAVSAVTGEALTNAGVSDVANLTKLVPALVVQPQGGSSTNFYLRGVGTYGTNAFAENAVAFNFGGVYIARPTSPIGTLFDLERLEVVKGPQGTLYGRNATGGAINVIPRKPTLNAFGADFGFEIANYETRKASGAINLPLGENLALRIAAQAVDRKGYLSDGYDDEEGEAFRASLLYRPSDRFSALLMADYFHQGGNGVGSVLVPDAVVPTAPPVSDRIGGSDPRSIAELRLRFPALVNSGLAITPRGDGFIDSRFWGFSAVIEAEFGFGTLTVIPAYRQSEPDFLSYNNGFQADVTEIDKQTSMEVRLASPVDQAMRYVAGAYYFKETQDAQDLFSQGAISTTIFNPRIETESKAIFGQLTYDLTDRLRLVGGARYTEEHKTQETPLRTLSPANPNPPFIQVTGDLTFDQVTWKAGAEYDAGENSLLYANVATGFKAGGFFVASRNNTFRPETLKAYTVGSKNRFLDNRLQINAEAFYWDYKDQQVNFIGPVETTPGVYGPAGVTFNAGNAIMWGSEIELLAMPTDHDRLSLNLQYLHSNYEQFQYTAISTTGVQARSGCVVSPNTSVPVAAPARLFSVDCSGKPALNSPEWTLNVGYEHTFELSGNLELIAGARTRIETSRYLAIDFLPEQQQGGYMMSDVYLTLQGPEEDWSVTAFVNNVEDETVYASSALRQVTPVVYNALRPPRTYGVRVSKSF